MESSTDGSDGERTPPPESAGTARRWSRRAVAGLRSFAPWAGSALGRLWRGGATAWLEDVAAYRRSRWERFRSGRRGGAVARGGARSWRWLRKSSVSRRVGLAIALLTVSVGGAVLGVTLTGNATAPIGPFQSSLHIRPDTSGSTRVNLPPLGSLTLDSHAGPLKLTVSLDALDEARTAALVSDPEGLEAASERALEDVITGLVIVALRAVAGAALAGLALGALLFRSVRRTAICGGLSLALTASAFGLAAATLRPQSIQEPRYDGLLANAPAVIGSAEKIADRYDEYREQLQKIVTNAAQLYTTARTLPTFEPDPNTIRVLHVSDLHLNPSAWSVIATVVDQFQIQAVLDTGDMTDWGTEQEAEAFTAPVEDLPVPYIYIRGNHDSDATAEMMAEYDNVTVLDGDVTTIAGGLTVAGIGDPRFTPDKSSSPTDLREEQVMYDNGVELRNVVEAADKPVDVCLVHDPVAATPLAGAVPLVLAGHKHERSASILPDSDTRLMVEGSTGGAGLRGLEHETPTPLELSVLYFGTQDHVLQAYDDITVGGTGQTEVSLQRHVIDEAQPSGTEPSGAPSGPAPSAS